MGAYNNQDAALAGLQVGLDPKIETVIAAEEIGFGEPVFGFVGEEEKGYAVHQDRAKTLLDADLITGNTITTIINGISIATLFAGSHAATMTAHIISINANASLIALGISAVAGSTNREIVITVKALDLTVTQAVTGGASQAGSTITYDTWAKFLGVSLFVQTGGYDYGAGTAKYEEGDAVNVVTDGEIWVPVSVAVQDKQPAYVIYVSGATQKQFTNSNSGTYDIGAYFRSNRNAQNLATLEVRGLK
jgi:hypothetical protein